MARAGEALEALARSVGLSVRPIQTPVTPKHFATDPFDAQTRWLETAAAALGLEAEAVDAAYGDVDWLIRGGGPALLLVRIDDQPCLLVLRAARRHSVTLVAPDLSVRRRVPLAAIRQALCEPLETPVAGEIERLLDEVGIDGARRRRARTALLRERLAATSSASCWLVRLPPGAGVEEQGSFARLWSRLAVLVGAHASAYVLWILSWWIVGRAALEGRLDRGLLFAWALLLFTLVPFELLVTWLQGRLAIDAGALLKRRLLHGALQLEPEEIRHQGAGQLLGRVIEAQAIEALALSGGFLAFVAGVELTMAAVILSTVSIPAAAALAACTAAAAAFGWRFFARRRAWTRSRLTMTHDLVERMVRWIAPWFGSRRSFRAGGCSLASWRSARCSFPARRRLPRWPSRSAASCSAIEPFVG
jgi:ATP-binding cassette subfamily B protein